MNIFLVLILSHFIGDYCLYIQWLSEWKRGPFLYDILFANGCHAIIHGIIIAILLMVFGIHPFEIIVLLVIGFHFLIDFTRCFLESKFKVVNQSRRQLVKDFFDSYVDWSKYRGTVLRAIVDQLAHLGSLVFIWLVVN